MADPIERLRRATARRQKAKQEWRDSILAAHADGQSLRAIAREADVTHVNILRIVRGRPQASPEYHKAHRAVEKARGKENRCNRCGTAAPDKIYDWANLTGNYADVMDYERMCRSCHRKYDRERREAVRGE